MALATESNIQRADPSTIHNKVLAGYQGWFTCHGDGEPVGPGHHGWLHWFGHPIPDGGNINIDVWPDVSAYTSSELFLAPGLKYSDGTQARLFSSRHPKTVQRHFRWMAENGVDGLFLQRFVGQCDMERDNAGIRRIRDEVGDVVKNAAEKEGRVFAIMYDLAGVEADRTQRIIESDWMYLVHVKRVLDSPNYLREGGKPVVAIWGFSFEYKERAPEIMQSVTDFIKKNTPGGAYIMAGTPSHWRADVDKYPEIPPAFMRCFDAICPWTVGVYGDANGADRYYEDLLRRDLEYIQQWEHEKGKHVDYIPTVHPGGSGYNVSQGKWARNGAPRDGGKYLWRQFYNTIARLGARTVYGAMWDEYDEGTNFLPAVPKTSQLPHDDYGKFKFIAYDVDGYDIPSDWYMRIAGYAAEALKGKYKLSETFPEHELRDWENSHPRLESRSAGASGSSSASGSQSYERWLSTLENMKSSEELPPPPYTLEAGPTATLVETARPSIPIATRPGPPSTSASTRPGTVETPATTQPNSYPPVNTRPQAPPVRQHTRPSGGPGVTNALAASDDLRRLSISSYSHSLAGPDRPEPPLTPAYIPPQSFVRPPPPRPQSTYSAPSQWPPPEWGIDASRPPPTSPHQDASSSYSALPSSSRYNPTYTPYLPMSSYPGMRTDSASPYIPAQPPSPGLAPPSPLSQSTTPPPQGPSMPLPSASAMPVPNEGFVGGFHELHAGSSHDSIYTSSQGLPSSQSQGALYGPPPPPPPLRPASARPSGRPSSYYAPPPRPSTTRPGTSSVQGYAQGAVGYATGAVGRLAGEDRRKKFEKGVEDLAQAGGRLFGRFK